MVTISTITEIINKWDPIDLLNSGAPNDEYSAEIRKIYEWCISNSKNVDSLAREILNIFTSSFGVDVFRKNLNDCISIAICINENWRN